MALAKRLGIKTRTAAHRRYVAWVRHHYDLADFGTTRSGGDISRTSTAALDRHLQADPKDWASKARHLSSTELALHRHSAATYHAVPRRQRPGEKQYATLRIDADAHQDGQQQADTLAALQWLSNTYLAGRLYIESTTRGAAAWLTIELPQIGIDPQGQPVYPSKWNTNRSIETLQVALRSHLEQRFNVTVEVQGKHTITGRSIDGTRREVVRRGTMGKLPRCPRDEDVDALLASSFNGSQVSAIIEGSPPAIPQPTPAAPVPAKPQKRSPRRTPRKIKDTGDKHRNRVQCVIAAVRELGDDADHTHIVDHANKLYEAAGLNGGERDAARDRAMRNIAKWYITSRDPSRAGSQRVWFDEADLQLAERRLRGTIPANAIRTLNEQHRKALSGCRLSYHTLAITACTIAKNVATSDGQVPAMSVRRMLNWFGIRANGTSVRLAMQLLQQVGAITATVATWVKGQCRKFSLGRMLSRLPFLSGRSEDQDNMGEDRDATVDRGGATSTAHINSLTEEYRGHASLFTLPVGNLQSSVVSMKPQFNPLDRHFVRDSA